MLSNNTFDPVAHVYRIDGKQVPSVTGVISPLINLSMVPEAALEFARDRGTAVHRATQLLDEDRLDRDSLDKRLVPYVAGWEKFTRDFDPKWTMIEESLYDGILGYAGTPDRVGHIKRATVIVDIKSTVVLSDVVAVQDSGYDLLLKKLTGHLADELWAVQLRPDGTYRHKVYKAEHAVFRSCLTLHHFKDRTK